MAYPDPDTGATLCSCTVSGLVNDVEYLVVVTGNTTAGPSYCGTSHLESCATVTPVGPRGLFAPMPTVGVVLLALVVVLTPLALLVANYKYVLESKPLRTQGRAMTMDGEVVGHV